MAKNSLLHNEGMKSRTIFISFVKFELKADEETSKVIKTSLAAKLNDGLYLSQFSFVRRK